MRTVTPRPGCGALDLRRASPRPCKSRPLPPLRLGCFVRRTRLGCAATGVTVYTGAEHGAGGNAGEEDGVTAAFASLNPDLKL